MQYANTKPKKAGVVIAISEKDNFKEKLISVKTGTYNIIMKEAIQLEHTVIHKFKVLNRNIFNV